MKKTTTAAKRKAATGRTGTQPEAVEKPKVTSTATRAMPGRTERRWPSRAQSAAAKDVAPPDSGKTTGSGQEAAKK